MPSVCVDRWYFKNARTDEFMEMRDFVNKRNVYQSSHETYPYT